jgi:hypothetical protein
MFLVAMLLAAAASPVQQPWVEIEAGPALLHQQGHSGVGSGPLFRTDVGYQVSERFAGEVWLTGSMQSAPLHSPGDTAVLGGGLHLGAGWSAVAAGEGAPGPTEFVGAMLTFQPFVQKFQVGLEADAVAFRNTIGGTLMPALRCTF